MTNKKPSICKIFSSLKTKAVMAAIAVAASASAFAAGPPKYVFYFIGDGMGMAQVINGNLFYQKVYGSESPLLMTTFPIMSMARTHSASSDVTDSAAAGTALATGSKTKNSMLGMNADTIAVTSVAKILHDDGYGVGLVTSVAIDDATPGAFYTHVPNRGQYYNIGRTLAECGYEFAAGAALRGTKNADGTPNDLMDYFAEQGVEVHYGLDGVDTATNNRMLVLSPYHEQDQNNIGYAIDSIPGAITLPQMTTACLDHLKHVSPDRFFMMVEGGSIDHAGHGNDGGTQVREMISFNEALQIAYDFYLAHPDETLILVTADHETGGLSVGCAATGYSAPVGVAREQKLSKGVFNSYCRHILDSKEPYTWEQMQSYLRDKLGFWSAVKLSDAETEELHSMFNSIFQRHEQGEDTHTLYESFNGFTTKVFGLLNSKAGFGWTSPSHTGVSVPVFAIGVDAQRFSGLNDNTDLPKKILQILGKTL